MADKENTKQPLIDYHFENIPQELKDLDQWVLWKLEAPQGKRKGTSAGKLTKVPYQPNGRKAVSVNPHTWCSFAAALAAWERGGFDGIGFVFAPDDPYCGIDLDHCYDPLDRSWHRVVISRERSLHPARIIFEMMSYAEFSVSGTGVHIIGRAKVPEGGNKKGGFEMYSQGRFFCFSGVLVPGAAGSITDIQEQVKAQHAEVWPAPKPKPKAPASTQGPGGQPPAGDAELLERMFNSQHGGEIRALWSGDLGSYPSGSEADLALCNYLIWWTNGNTARADALFRQSGLMRDKWDAKRGSLTYGERTLQQALAGFDGRGYSGQRPHDGHRPNGPAPRPPAAAEKALQAQDRPAEAPAGGELAEEVTAESEIQALVERQLPELTAERELKAIAKRHQVNLGPVRAAYKKASKGAGTVTGDPEHWTQQLLKGPRGGLKLNDANFCSCIENLYGPRLKYNEFSGMVLYEPEGEDWRPFDEDDAFWMTVYINKTIKLDIKTHQAYDTAIRIAKQTRFHPVKEYLEHLDWDGVERLHDWTVEYLGAKKDSDFAREVGRMWLLAAVARIYQPGCQAENILVLEGDQGIGKTQALKILGGQWFGNDMPSIADKDSKLYLMDSWIIEAAEMDAFDRATANKIKAFMSVEADKFRAPYEKDTRRVPRHVVFAATVNEFEYLKDSTGGRRYWPVRVGDIDLVGLRNDRDQLLAEAYVAYHQGQKWWITNPTILAEAQEEQANRTFNDSWTDLIAHYITHEPEYEFTKHGTSTLKSIADWYRPRAEPLDSVAIKEILPALGYMSGRWGRGDEMRVAKCLQELGWRKRRMSKDPVTGLQPRRYYRLGGEAKV